MKIFYDCEFLEDGKTIDLISIGMVREDGAEYYAVNSDADWERILQHAWLVDNVIPSLPGRTFSTTLLGKDKEYWEIDTSDSSVKPAWVLANEVRDFILATPDPALWAWYGAYDHVAIAQLWGPMINLPEGVPMYTNDLKQECDRLGNPTLPIQESGHHNALHDARQVQAWAKILETGSSI